MRLLVCLAVLLYRSRFDFSWVPGQLAGPAKYKKLHPGRQAAGAPWMVLRKLKTGFVLVVFVVVFCSAAPASAQVIITEIMYNPDSFEGGVGKDAPPNQTEWIEIYNAGKESVSLAGWHLKDEDGQTVGLPDTAKIAPGEAVVLIPGVQSVADFREAWGTGYQVFKLKGWAKGDNPLSNLANSPSEKNEQLTLCDKEGSVVDAVNYDDENGWPKDTPDGPSITLSPDALDAEKNDEGKYWARSEKGKRGAEHAKKTEEYSEQDVGSPGKVLAE